MEKPFARKMSGLGGVIRSLRARGWLSRCRAAAELVDAWDEMLEAEHPGRTNVAGYDNGVLTVEVDKADLLISHGNLIRCLISLVLGIEPNAWADMGTGNCGITTVRIYPDGRKILTGYNDVGHLPPVLHT